MRLATSNRSPVSTGSMTILGLPERGSRADFQVGILFLLLDVGRFLVDLRPQPKAIIRLTTAVDKVLTEETSPEEDLWRAHGVGVGSRTHLGDT